MKTKKDVSKRDMISQNVVNLVVARIDATVSSNLKLARGFGESLDKEKMIEHVKRGDEIGRRIIQSHLNFMKAQASGQLMSALNQV